MPEIKQQEVGTVESPLSTNGYRPTFNKIKVVLSFEDYDPFIFVFKRQPSSDIKKQKQEFYGLSEEEQKARTQEFRCGILAEQLDEIPEFPLVEWTDNFKADFNIYFSDENNEELLGFIWSEYQDKTYPKELLSKLTE